MGSAHTEMTRNQELWLHKLSQGGTLFSSKVPKLTIDRGKHEVNLPILGIGFCPFGMKRGITHFKNPNAIDLNDKAKSIGSLTAMVTTNEMQMVRACPLLISDTLIAYTAFLDAMLQDEFPAAF